VLSEVFKNKRKETIGQHVSGKQKQKKKTIGQHLSGKQKQKKKTIGQHLSGKQKQKKKPVFFFCFYLPDTCCPMGFFLLFLFA
jgi:hypothetical protein